MLNILYICTHNRCRSILSEAITRKLAPDLIRAQSAGSVPVAEVHPLSIKYLQQAGYDTQGLSSKSWDELDTIYPNFTPDVVITVCDQAAGESCPLWLGSTPKLHWGLSDPSKLAAGYDKEGHNLTDVNQQTEQAFQATIAQIESRVRKLIEVAKLPKEQQLDAIKQLVTA